MAHAPSVADVTVIKLEEVDSTNRWLKENRKESGLPLMVYAVSQTAGRGQRGNSWEAENGKNLTASIGFVPYGVEPKRQFSITLAVSLAVTDLLAEKGIEAKVKWPNDIYVGESKIAGILIENSIMGREITETVAGIGLNVNQTEFHSDAPNPVSMAQLTGLTYDIDDMAALLVEKVTLRLSGMSYSEQGPEKLMEEYMAKLWRHDGRPHRFLDRKEMRQKWAYIVSVAPDGVIALRDTEGNETGYYFKEIEFLPEDDSESLT